MLHPTVGTFMFRRTWLFRGFLPPSSGDFYERGIAAGLCDRLVSHRDLERPENLGGRIPIAIGTLRHS